MALIVGPLISPETADQAVAEALSAHSPDRTPIGPDQIRLLWGLSRYGALVMGWDTETPLAHDDQVLTLHGRQQGNLWRPTGSPRPAPLRRGVVMETDRGWMVAASHGEPVLDLIEHVVAHLDFIDSKTQGGHR